MGRIDKWNYTKPPKDRAVLLWHSMWDCLITVRYNESYNPDCPWMEKTLSNCWPTSAFIPNLWMEAPQKPEI